jgi:hypothetical protein
MIIGYIYTQLQTAKHKLWVCYYISKLCLKLMWRALTHDLHKFRWIEAKGFAKTIFKLKHSTYGTDEYKELLKIIKPSIDHHYKNNRHHPEHHDKGFQDMSFVDRVEMILDWRSACRRHKDGDIHKSIEQNQKRFGYTDVDKEWMKKIIEIID